MEDYLPEAQTQKQQKSSALPYVLGCVGCFGVLCIIALIGLGYVGFRAVNFFADMLLEEEPLAIAAVEATPEDIEAVQQKVTQWLESAQDDGDPLELDARELNIYLQYDEELQEVFEGFHIEIDGDVVTAQISIKIPFPTKARYFNAEFTGNIGIENGVLDLDIHEGRFGSKDFFDDMFEESEYGFSQEMMIQEMFSNNPEFESQFRQVESLKVEDGKVRITLR